MTKKKGSDAQKKKKSGPKNPTLAKDKVTQLQDLFLQGGTTSYKASTLVKCDPKTARLYFIKFAKELTAEDTHEDWLSREKRVRQQALEGYANDIETLRVDIKRYREILDTKLITKDDHQLIDQYERIVRLNTVILNEKLDTFNAIQLEPPNEILLEEEIQRRLNAKSGTKDNTK